MPSVNCGTTGDTRAFSTASPAPRLEGEGHDCRAGIVPALETLASIFVLLDAPGRHLAGAWHRRAGLRDSKAMAVPALSKRKRNSALGEWLPRGGRSRRPGRTGFRWRCWFSATNLFEIGPMPTPRASRITDTIEPILPSY